MNRKNNPVVTVFNGKKSSLPLLGLASFEDIQYDR